MPGQVRKKGSRKRVVKNWTRRYKWREKALEVPGMDDEEEQKRVQNAISQALQKDLEYKAKYDAKKNLKNTVRERRSSQPRAPSLLGNCIVPIVIFVHTGQDA